MNPLLIVLYVLLGLLAVYAVLFLIAVLRAVFMKKEFADDKPFDPYKDGIDCDAHAEHLSKIIQVPTVSIRGRNDNTEIYKFHDLLEQQYPNIHRVCERVDIDGALLFIWRGKDKNRNPICLMSHQDVVPADSEKWKYDAFSGKIAEGKIWGRGTVDTKGALCAILESIEELIKEGFTPVCDVYVGSSNNEEITGDGAVKTVEYLYEKGIHFDLVMDEGGSVMSYEDSVKGRMVAHNAMIGILEKGRANIKFTARSRGGHASVPFNNNPFAKLSKLMYIIEHRNPFKKRITHPARVQYHAIYAPLQTPPAVRKSVAFRPDSTVHNAQDRRPCGSGRKDHLHIHYGRRKQRCKRDSRKSKCYRKLSLYGARAFTSVV